MSTTLEAEVYKLHMRLMAIETKEVPSNLQPDESLVHNAAIVAKYNPIQVVPTQPASNIPPLVPQNQYVSPQTGFPVPPYPATGQTTLVQPHVSAVPNAQVAPAVSPSVPARPVVAPVVPVHNPAPVVKEN